jgi:hypothetical protein
MAKTFLNENNMFSWATLLSFSRRLKLLCGRNDYVNNQIYWADPDSAIWNFSKAKKAYGRCSESLHSHFYLYLLIYVLTFLRTYLLTYVFTYVRTYLLNVLTYVRTYVCTYLSTYLLIYYLLTSWSTVLLENLTCSQLVKKFPAFYGTRRFITAFTNARHLSLTWASSIQSTPPHPTSWSSALIL